MSHAEVFTHLEYGSPYWESYSVEEQLPIKSPTQIELYSQVYSQEQMGKQIFPDRLAEHGGNAEPSDDKSIDSALVGW